MPSSSWNEPKPSPRLRGRSPHAIQIPCHSGAAKARPSPIGGERENRALSVGISDRFGKLRETGLAVPSPVGYVFGVGAQPSLRSADDNVEPKRNSDSKVPSRTTDNSPRFQPWEAGGKSPEPGAKEKMRLGRRVLSSLTGLDRYSRNNPAMNRWAIFGRPCGTWTHETLTSFPVGRERVRVRVFV
jgi:hypothetical protein